MKEVINDDGPWISVDPGLSGTGAALWKGHVLQNVFSLGNPGRDEWYENAAILCARMSNMVFGPSDLRFYCYELPAYIEKAKKQNLRQDIVKLTITAGMLAASAMNSLSLKVRFSSEAIYPVPILKWKGQVEKKMMNNRTLAALKRNPHIAGNWSDNPATLVAVGDHGIDAIGIGLYMLGVPQ